MMQNSMVVDVAHTSSEAIQDIASLARYYNKPIISSHGGVRDCYDRLRNLSHEDLIAIAGTNGVIGIGLYEKFVGGKNPIDVANCIRRTVDYLDSNAINGVDHLGLGSDFDGAVETTVDAAHLAAITGALTQVGFDDQEEIDKIMGGNMARAIRASLP